MWLHTETNFAKMVENFSSSRVTLVLFRTRRRDECLRLKERREASRSKKPSEGSRWRGGRGTYANWMERGRGVEVSGSGQGRWSSSWRICAKTSWWPKRA